MELLTKIVADAANKGEHNKLNVLGIFHSVWADNVPTTLSNLALALEFQAQLFEKGKAFDIHIALYDPDHKMLFQINGNLSISINEPALEPIIPMVFNIGNVLLPVLGNYRFEISVNGAKKGEIQLEVLPRKSPAPGDSPQ